MPLESGTYIDDLVATNPTGTDTRRQGDDHIRLIKKTLLNSFPNIDGAVTATPAQLNLTTDPTNFIPTGLISMWSGLVANIPAGWTLCDGTAGTPDLRGKFIVAATGDTGGSYNVNTTGGSADIPHPTVTESHTLTVNQMPNHQHQGGSCNAYATKYGTSTAGPTANRIVGSGLVSSDDSPLTSYVGGGQGHSHNITFDGSGDNIPPYYAIAYIMKT